MTRSPFALLAALTAALLASAAAVAAEPTKATAEPAKPTAAKVKVYADVTYAKIDGEVMQLDLVVPDAPGPHPVVLCFHGGAWSMGSRKELTSPAGLLSQVVAPPAGEIGLTRRMAEKGIAAASVSYRLAPKHQFPAQIVDAKTAVRFLRKNADQYNLDPDRVAALGFSSGGHLAALLGLTDTDAGFDGDLYPGVSSKVKCVVDFFGPTDLSLYADTPGLVDSFMVPLLGKGCRTDECAAYKKASPMTYVTKAAAPTLIIHGTADIVVPVIHSERFYDKLKEAGVPTEIVKIKGKGHGWTDPDAVKKSADAGLKFLSEHLLPKDEKK